MGWFWSCSFMYSSCTLHVLWMTSRYLTASYQCLPYSLIRFFLSELASDPVEKRRNCCHSTFVFEWESAFKKNPRHKRFQCPLYTKFDLLQTFLSWFLEKLLTVTTSTTSQGLLWMYCIMPAYHEYTIYQHVYHLYVSIFLQKASHTALDCTVFSLRIMTMFYDNIDNVYAAR